MMQGTILVILVHEAAEAAHMQQYCCSIIPCLLHIPILKMVVPHVTDAIVYSSI